MKTETQVAGALLQADELRDIGGGDPDQAVGSGTNREVGFGRFALAAARHGSTFGHGSSGSRFRRRVRRQCVCWVWAYGTPFRLFFPAFRPLSDRFARDREARSLLLPDSPPLVEHGRCSAYCRYRRADVLRDAV